MYKIKKKPPAPWHMRVYQSSAPKISLRGREFLSEHTHDKSKFSWMKTICLNNSFL